MRFIQVAVFLSIALCELSCISIRGSSKQDYLDADLPPVSRKISVNFANKSVVREGGRERSASHKPIVEGYMLASDYFLTGQALPGAEDLYFLFKTVAYDDGYSWLTKGGQFIYQAVSLFTAAVVPYYWRNSRRLEVGVYQKSKLLKRYWYKDYYSDLIWVLALPWWRPFQSSGPWSGGEEAMREVDHNLVKRFLVDLRRDFLPKPTTK